MGADRALAHAFPRPPSAARVLGLARFPRRVPARDALTDGTLTGGCLLGRVALPTPAVLAVLPVPAVAPLPVTPPALAVARVPIVPVAPVVLPVPAVSLLPVTPPAPAASVVSIVVPVPAVSLLPRSPIAPIAPIALRSPIVRGSPVVPVVPGARRVGGPVPAFRLLRRRFGVLGVLGGVLVSDGGHRSPLLLQ
ncbi:hypothetical protein [Streptomyces sp. NPDC005549]|uniref:hypothetical protein n=1 Tax=Streptomyces sp. NPDC005549 TaxID=3154888 RepID=UPI0033AA9D97